MTKFTYFGSFLMALTLIVGSVWFSQSFVMSFASGSVIIDIARGVIAILMLALMVTNPPRSLAFRTTLGMAAIGFATWGVNYALSGSIALADVLLFLHAGLSFGIAALEPSLFPFYTRDIEVEEHESEPGEVKVRTKNALA